VPMHPDDAAARHADELNIRGRLELYGFAVDARRWDLFDQIFSRQDLSVRHGDNFAHTDYQEFVDAFDRIHVGFDITRHSMSNFIIDVDGDIARSLTYGQWRLVKLGLSGGDCWSSEGWYEDHWIRESVGWRITRRQSWELWGEGNSAIAGVDQTQFRARRRALATSEHAAALFLR